MSPSGLSGCGLNASWKRLNAGRSGSPVVSDSTFARQRYPIDRASYHVSAELHLAIRRSASSAIRLSTSSR